MTTAIAIPYVFCYRCGKQKRGFSCWCDRPPLHIVDIGLGSLFAGLSFMPKISKPREKIVMKLPEGEERKAIQDAINTWRNSEKYRYLIEVGLYQVVEKYLPDTSTTMGFIATMMPTMLGVVVDLKKFESEDVVMWTDDDDEIQFGSPPDPPEDAIRIPYPLLTKLLRMHGTSWLATKTAEEAWGPKGDDHTTQGE